MKLTHPVGTEAEERALQLLLNNGLKLVERNWHCRGGELDLIMRDGEQWIFVEVRHRSSEKFGGALGSITADKCRKLQHAATVYLNQHRIDAPCRFDAVISNKNQVPTWLKNII